MKIVIFLIIIIFTFNSQGHAGDIWGKIKDKASEAIVDYAKKEAEKNKGEEPGNVQIQVSNEDSLKVAEPGNSGNVQYKAQGRIDTFSEDQLYKRLVKLRRLNNRGIISDVEFEVRRQEAIDQYLIN